MNESLIRLIRENYDRLAADYADHLSNELERKPLDRELLDRLVRKTSRRGDVCDMGCGPGQVARYLHDSGATVFGIDISSGMIDEARKRNPEIRFQQGDIMALDLADNQLAGIAAFYAVVNFPKQSLPLIFAEMHRVLQPGGVLLLAFHIGDEVIRPEELWGHRVTMDWFFFPSAEIERLLEGAGFRIEEVIDRAPYGPEVEHQSRRAYIFATKSGMDQET
jgi:ubiquinone/menaquinone biosynthesis C-methylase UbiE